MVILYVFKVNDPNTVGGFPPSVMTNSWYTNLIHSFDLNGIGGFGQYTNVLIFADETELNSWISTHTLNDTGLLADISAWKSAHGVSYSSQYFTLTDAGVSLSPIVS
jgi:hypothetical protein